MEKRPCLFLDRDGTINVDHGYVGRYDDVAWIPGAKEVIRRFNEAGWLVVVVTNQSGVARGMFGSEDVDVLHREMARELAASGARIDRFYFCPYHPEAQMERWRQDHHDRKPNPGMIEKAMRDLSIDPTCAFLVGDKMSDVEAARNAGIPGYLFDTWDLRAFFEKHGLFMALTR